MGTDRITLKNVEIVRIDAENNLLFVKGPLPGAKNTLLEIRN
jgi:large subunit ribosomal protein L3